MIYLNNAATSHPKPKQVIESVMKCLSSIPFHSDRAGYETKTEDIKTHCRKNLAALLNIDNFQNIVFTSGATESLNLAFNGLDLQGKHVITTQSEHNSVIRPLKTLERDGGISLSFAPCDNNGIVDVECIADLIQHDTALIALNHCSNVTGNCNDINSISKIARVKNIILLVDASQSAGVIPIDLGNTPVDLLVFTGHKALYGIPGTGGLYLKEGLNIKPLKTGGTGINSDLLFQPDEMPMLYEAGTPNTPGIAALNAGVEFILEKGISTIAEKENHLIDHLVDRLMKINGIELYGDYQTPERSPVLSFNLPHITPDDAGYILENSFKIIVRSGLHCAPLIHESLGTYPEGSLRVSLSYFTRHEEIDSFADAVEQLSSMKW